MRASFGQMSERFGRLLTRAGYHGRLARALSDAAEQRMRHVGRPGASAGVGAQPPGEPSGFLAQPVVRGGVEHEERGLRLGLHRGDRRGLSRCRGRPILLNQDVRVRAAEAERRYASGRSTRIARPRLGLGDDAQRVGLEVDVRAGLGEVQLFRHVPVVQREHGLDEPCDTRGRLEVTEVRLHRPDQQRLVRGTPGTEHRTQGSGLDRVAERGAGAVRLHVVELVRRDRPALAVDLGQQSALRLRVRGNQPVRSAIRVDGGSADHGEHTVPGPLRIGEAAQHEHAAALGTHHAVGSGVEGLAAAVRRQRPRALEGQRDRRGKQGIDARDERRLALPRQQAAHRVVHGHE